MRILLIAMSGVRAWSEELNRAKLSMPGVVERGNVIASLPSLGLLTLAALTPPDIAVDYREIRDLRLEPASELPMGYDLVAISSFTAQICDAYDVADYYRMRGVPVVMGGLHVSVLPDEALQHCTAVAVGEGEVLWPRIIEDLRAGRLQERYVQSADEQFDLAYAPIPRFQLLDIRKYNRLTVQTSRGCPHKCHFCASSILLTKKYKLKPVPRIIDEIRAIKRRWRRPFIEFADDNSFVNKAHARELMRALRAERIRWFTETDISIARDPELLDLMRESGCRQILVGLESPTPAGLDGVELRRNFKLRQLPDYEGAVREIQSRGIAVNGCFILGLDGDTPAVFDEIHAFAERTSLFDVQLTVVTPFPGTPLRESLRQQGRLLHEGKEAWRRCTLFDPDYLPRSMSPEELQAAFLKLAFRVYDPASAVKRRAGFFAGVRHGCVRPNEYGQPEAA
jgi:radical SAM superfamily enzyme YgiQ (UPF0313 family)